MISIEITPIKANTEAAKIYLEYRRTTLADRLVEEAETLEDKARRGEDINEAVRTVSRTLNELNTIEYSLKNLG